LNPAEVTKNQKLDTKVSSFFAFITSPKAKLLSAGIKAKKQDHEVICAFDSELEPERIRSHPAQQ